jgi:translocation and assembly module TamA
MGRPMLFDARFILRTLFLATTLYTGAADAQNRYRVEVHGPRALSQMLESGLDIARWQNDPNMNLELLRRLTAEAIQQSEAAVATEGYFSPRIEAQIDEKVEPWLVSIDVDPGPRTIVQNVDLRFAGPVLDDEEAQPLIAKARETWSLPPGSPFRQQDWDSAKRGALTALSFGRYAAANVAHSEARIDPDTLSASLQVEFASGPIFHFGAVETSGLKRYPPRLVENLSPFGPGEAYSGKKLAIYQRRLLESGYFSSARIAVSDDPDEAAAAPVKVSVIENNKHRVEMGVGYSTDTRYRGQLTYNNVDLFESAWRFKANLRLESLGEQARIDFDSPPHSDASWNNFFSSVHRTDIENQETREFVVGAAHNWGLERTPSSLFVAAHFEDQTINNDVTDKKHAVFFGYRKTFSDTDDLVSPRSGYLGTLTVGAAPEVLSSRAFARATAKLSTFYPIGRKADLSIRGELGKVWAEARDNIPTSYLFRTGGDQTVRGYGFESLGLEKDGAIVSGRYLGWASIEYTRWIGEAWGLAAFVDAGDASDSLDAYDLAVGYGLGVRFRSPIGPVRADVAYGERTNEMRIHFSVGYSF